MRLLLSWWTVVLSSLRGSQSGVADLTVHWGGRGLKNREPVLDKLRKQGSFEYDTIRYDTIGEAMAVGHQGDLASQEAMLYLSVTLLSHCHTSQPLFWIHLGKTCRHAEIQASRQSD